MQSLPGVPCPKCRSGDFTRKACEVYTHYKHKEAVKNFFGAEVCEIPDYLKDAAFDLLEKKDEYEIAADEGMHIQDDTSTESEFSDMKAAVTEGHRKVIPDRSVEQDIGVISPPLEPRLIGMPFLVPTGVFLGGTMIATFVGIKFTMVDFKYVKMLLPAGFSLIVFSAVIFAVVTFRNQGLVDNYEKGLGEWKKKYVCARCRMLFIP
jgi:hypothetical protein